MQDPTHELYSLPNVVAFPHCGIATQEVVESFVDLMVDNIVRFREGRPLLHQLTMAPDMEP